MKQSKDPFASIKNARLNNIIKGNENYFKWMYLNDL